MRTRKDPTTMEMTIFAQRGGSFGVMPPPCRWGSDHTISAMTMYPPGYQAAPARRRKLWPFFVIAAVLVLCGGCLIAGGINLAAMGRHSTTVTPVGGSAADGGLTFHVEQMDCSSTSVGTGPVTRRAQGRFCVVQLSVGNRGSSARTFLATLQRALDAQGREYSPDDVAGLLVTPDAWVNQVNPGVTLRGAIVFDVPAGVELTHVVLHGGAFSRGVKVTVR